MSAEAATVIADRKIEQVLDVEAADREFDALCAMWDLETDELSDKEEKAMRAARTTLTRWMRRGDLVVDPTEEVVTLKLRFSKLNGVTELVFHVPGGDALLAIDGYGTDQTMHQQAAYTASMTNQPKATINALDGRDLRPCRELAQLFLAS